MTSFNDTRALSGAAAGPREWTGLGLLALGCALISVNSNLLNLALPAISADLRPTAPQLLWISDAYVFAVAALLLPMGVVADRFGRRRVLLLGAAIFGAASLAAAAAPDAPTLIASRTLLGAAGAMIAPSTLSLIRSMFQHDRQRAKALGIWTAGFAVGGVIGPVIGGAVLEVASWRAVFLVTPPAMMLLLGLGPATLPEYRSERARRIDVVGTALAVAGLVAVVWAVKQTTAAATWPLAVGFSGVLVLVLFVRRQGRVNDPVLDLGLFRRRTYSVPLAANALAFAVLYGNQLLTGQYLQSVLAFGPLVAGVWTIPSAVAYAAGGLIAPWLIRRFSQRWVLVGGLVASAAGFGIQTAVGVSHGVVSYVIGSAVAAAGLAPVYLVTTGWAVTAVPTERAGVAGATLETLTNVGGALGIALFGTLAAGVYRVGVERAGLTSGTIGDLAATSSTDAAVEVARAAFVDGFRWTAVVGAVVLLGAAAAAARLLPAPGADGRSSDARRGRALPEA